MMNIVKKKPISLTCQIPLFLVVILNTCICKLGHQGAISQLAKIFLWIQRTKAPLAKVSNPFLHRMPLLVNFSDCFLTIMATDCLSMTVTCYIFT